MVVDLARGRTEVAIDWNKTDIDIEGRGGDRGLRGICIVGDSVFVLSSSALLRFDLGLNLEQRYTNPFLKHGHELCFGGGLLYATSTGFDSILAFDPVTERFTSGFHLRNEHNQLKLLAFDARSLNGPQASNRFHLNSVACDESGIYFAGLRSPGLLHSDGRKLQRKAPLPRGTHNAQPFRGGILFNDTEGDRVVAQHADRRIEMDVPRSFEGRITGSGDDRLARPYFARGLAVIDHRFIVGGSSPSTLTLYDLDEAQAVHQLNLTMDVRNAIHGLAVLPS